MLHKPKPPSPGEGPSGGFEDRKHSSTLNLRRCEAQGCDRVLKPSRRRPRRFCGDRCRKAASRISGHNSESVTEPTSPAPARSDAGFQAPVDLLGDWLGKIDPNLRRLIIFAEIGGDA